MRKQIKRYELNSNVNIELLKKFGFRKRAYIKDIPYTTYFYYKYLCDDIELTVDIIINQDQSISFDDFENVMVLDDNFCQPYTPFYNENSDFPFLNQVITKYNMTMDKLVNNGILNEKKKEIEKENRILKKEKK